MLASYLDKLSYNVPRFMNNPQCVPLKRGGGLPSPTQLLPTYQGLFLLSKLGKIDNRFISTAQHVLVHFKCPQEL